MPKRIFKELGCVLNLFRGIVDDIFKYLNANQRLV